MLRRLIASLLLPATLAVAVSGCATAPAGALRAAAPQEAKGMVSAADPRAAEAGAAMLRAGGSATDAALAVMLALTVVEPQSSGIGGGGFLVLDPGDGAPITYDGRETAPAAATPGWFMRDGRPLPFGSVVPGGRSTGVPGNVALMAKAHAAHGKLAWAKLFEPAIALAGNGFAVTQRLHDTLASARDKGAFSPAAKALFYGPDGEPLPVGTIVRNPALAAFLRRLAAEGRDAFYEGANAAAIAAAVSTAPQSPAPLAPADIAAYEAKQRPAVCATYRAHRICGMGPPSSGATTVIATVKQLERFDIAGLGPQSPLAWHLIAESMRLAFADRDRWLGDADFVEVPVAGLIDPGYLAARSALIAPDATMATAAAGTPPGAEALARADHAGAEIPSTSHLVAVDAQGSVASVTSTIEGPFGSGLFVNGFFLNNELTDFSFVPEQDGRPVANRVEGGKRPRSSMSPTIVYGPDGAFRLAVGAAGGSTIIAQTAKAIIAVIDWGMPARDAIAAPVLFAPGDVFVEQGTALEAMIPALEALGHADIATVPSRLFKGNAVERVDGGLAGAADPRSEGAVAVP